MPVPLSNVLELKPRITGKKSVFNSSLILYRFTYDEKMKVESITSSVSSLALAFGEGSNEKVQMSRPFGVALLFAGVDKNGPRYVVVLI